MIDPNSLLYNLSFEFLPLKQSLFPQPMWPALGRRKKEKLQGPVPTLGLKRPCTFPVTLLHLFPHHKNILTLSVGHRKRAMRDTLSRATKPANCSELIQDWQNCPPELSVDKLTYKVMKNNNYCFKPLGFGIVCYSATPDISSSALFSYFFFLFECSSWSFVGSWATAVH